ncbi:ubiquitin domain-containing protein UBFD1-like isoform X1 [Mya arenaria]|uniref:ubiquitin domain-containing protein UBFD1-like isoform X1 n=2 Tax=Mya arenaria TaxID=6604 RepID=UPI0022E78A7F|nr:ubiquitin domain-containing protein UBFD1-like isoform X1 [Mya arenaria]
MASNENNEDIKQDGDEATVGAESMATDSSNNAAKDEATSLQVDIHKTDVEVNSETDKPVADSGGGAADSTQAQTENCDKGETVTFKVIYNKQKYDITFELDKTILDLKKHVQTLTGVPSAMQKLMFKGLAKDENTLRELKVTKTAKIMVVGSTMNDVLQVTNTPSQKELQEEEKAATSKEPLCQQKQHKKVLDKYGKPDDALPGIRKKKEALPAYPLTGMYNKAGGKVRLTFKMELDQVWLGTKERTEKLPMNSIKAVVSEPLVGHEEYHMLALQLGPTEASRYWIYWVPAQYVDAIKDTVLGKWQLF